MNLNNFFLSLKDKKNIKTWLKTFDKPLFISGKTGIGKTILVNTILKDYTQIIIDPHLTTNISEFIDKTINDNTNSDDFSHLFNHFYLSADFSYKKHLSEGEFNVIKKLCSGF